MKENKQSEIDRLLLSIKERNREQAVLLAVSKKLAAITDQEELRHFLNEDLKSHIAFNRFVLCATDENEKQYQVIFHDEVKQFLILQKQFYDINDGFFDVALQFPEAIKFDTASFNKAQQKPDFIGESFKSGMKVMIAYPLHYQKKNPLVLFIFLDRADKFDREAQRFLNGINIQLSITASNIILKQNLEQQLFTVQDTTSKEITTQQSNKKTAKNSETVLKFIGKSSAFQKVNHLIEQVSASDSTVLILGESGTGKELAACKIHENSTRKHKRMVTVNCAAIPAHLIESELFGHEKGSFTGATEKRIGKFELAHNSTLFLDEIGELPLGMQTKLLRALQEKEIERIGGKRILKVNVRIIAATNRDLITEMEEGRFRKDLFYRLNVFPITLPPLRERKEDIEALCLHFLHYFATKSNKKNIKLSGNALQSALNYSWPGNIRELQHCMERSVLLAEDQLVNEIHFLTESEKILSINNFQDVQIKPLKEIEKEYILKIIKLCNGRISGPNGAAKKLQIPSTTLMSKMKKLGIKKQHFSE